jgi:hypothetical protein
VFRRALGHDSFPQISRLGKLAWLRLRGRHEMLIVSLAEWFFVLDGLLMLPNAIDQPVACGDKEKPAEVVRVDEAPAGLAEAAEQIRPHRLDDVA